MNPSDNRNMATQENLLLLPTVAKALFQAPQWSAEDLKNCRLVCKLWFEESLRKWRNTAVVTLQNAAHLEPQKRKDEYSVFLQRLGPTVNVGNGAAAAPIDPNDLQLVKLGEHPFSKYRLHKLNITTGDVARQREPWTSIAQRHVKYLHLDSCHYIVVSETVPTLGFNTETLMERLLLMPQLEELVLSDDALITCSALSDGFASHTNVKIFRVHGVQVEWRSALLRFPSLEQVEITRSSSAGFAEAVISLGPLAARLPLQRIDLIDSIPPGANINWNNWMRELPHLTFLSVSLPSTLSESQAIGAFTALFMKSRGLQILKIHRPQDVLPFAEFPDGVPMQSLEELELWGNVASSLLFLRFSCNLKKLVVKYNCLEKWRPDPSEEKRRRLKAGEQFDGDMVDAVHTSCDSLASFRFNSLELFEMDYELGVRSLTTLSKWLPNLKTLRTIFNNLSFRAVCQLWPNLQELACLYGSSVDETGGLLNFRNLTDLSCFRYESACGDGKISDLSVRHGFMKMNLYKLQICVSHELSPEAESLLKERIVLLEVVRNYGTGHQSNSTFFNCCQRKRYEGGTEGESAGLVDW